MSAADDDLDSYAELLAARAKARAERLKKLPTSVFEPPLVKVTDKENKDNNQTAIIDVKVDTPVCEVKQVVECDSSNVTYASKQEIASKRARRFEDILKRSEDEENTWECKRPDYKNAKRSEVSNNSWSQKSPKLCLTPTIAGDKVSNRSLQDSPQKTVTSKTATPVVTKEWNKPDFTLQVTPTINIDNSTVTLSSQEPATTKPEELKPVVTKEWNKPNVTSTTTPKVDIRSNIISGSPQKPGTSKVVVNNLNIRPLPAGEKNPKELQDFFSKSKEEEATSDRSRTFVDTVNMFQSMQQTAASKNMVDPSELPLNARKALFEKAMFKGSEAKRARKEEPTQQYIPRPKPLFTPTISNEICSQPVVEVVQERESITSEVHANISHTENSQCDTNTDMEITNISDSFKDQIDTCEEVDHSVISALKEIDDLSECADQSTGRLYPELPTLEESEASFSYALESSPTKATDSRSNCSLVEQLSPIKKYIPPQTSEESKPILRTLSTYRREQKQIAAMNSPKKEVVDFEEKFRLEKERKTKEEKQKASEMIETLRREVAEKHNTVIAQATTALNVIFSSGSSGDFMVSKERIEAEKILLVATQKRIRCVNEIQKLKQSLDKNDFNYENVNGTVLISNILVHVKGDFVLSQVGKYDKFKHYFICFLHVNGKLVSTELLSASSVIENACLTFTNNIPFNDLKSDFKIEVEVYGLALPKNASKKDATKFLSLTPKLKSKQRNASPKSPGGPNVVRSSNFSRLGYAVIDMKNRFDAKHSLHEFVYDSPLEGTIEITMSTRAQHAVEMKGDLNFREVIDGYRSWNRRWCVLKGYFLAYWRFAEEETTKESIGVIDLRQCVNPNFGPLPYEVCSRKNSFAIVTQTANHKSVKDNYKTMSTTMHLISTDVKEEFEAWCSKLEELIANIRRWEIDAVRAFDASNFDKALK